MKKSNIQHLFSWSRHGQICEQLEAAGIEIQTGANYTLAHPLASPSNPWDAYHLGKAHDTSATQKGNPHDIETRTWSRNGPVS